LHLRRDLDQFLRPLLDSRICSRNASSCAGGCWLTQRVCSGNGSIRPFRSARALFPWGSLYSLEGKSYLASVAARGSFHRVRCAANTTRVRVSSRNSRDRPGGIHTVGRVLAAATGSTRAQRAGRSC
jgi:hypothetical protein